MKASQSSHQGSKASLSAVRSSQEGDMPPAAAGGQRNADGGQRAGVGDRQRTLARSVTVRGRGLLLGEEAVVVIEPAPANHGIVFLRTDLSPAVRIPASAGSIARRARRTTLRAQGSRDQGIKGSRDPSDRQPLDASTARSLDACVETVEHCMSALAGLRIDNALVRIDGPELPCGDGSAWPYVRPMLEAGVVEQDAPRRVYRITEPIVVEEEGGAMLAAFPSDEAGLRVMFDLDYGDNSHRIKRQTQSFILNGQSSVVSSQLTVDSGQVSEAEPENCQPSTANSYVEQIARARTYSLKEEAQQLWDRGMCQHLTPRDVLVIGDDGPIDNEYRYDNEPVRHKIVDLLGDLYLVGCEVHGRFVAYKSGHELNRRMCLKIIEQMEAQHRREVSLRGRELDVRSIQRIMPHRYPMLLVDRVVEIEGDRKAIGVKNVTINEPFFQGHYPGTPIMPGVLVVEAMAQLGGLLMSQKLEHTGKIAVLLSLDRVKLRHPVTPGDQLMLEAEAIRAKARTGTMRCKAYVGSKVAAEAQIRFMMVDAEQD